MSALISNTLGWIGTTLFLIAYYLVSNKKIDATGKSFQLINLAGALCLGINVFHQKAWAALGLEVAWATIAILALTKRRNT
ncbi:MAG: hypothetical protein H6754_04985 [Candidatus Omnitrophica bacterium]|nr:hypothetical protein [Candidatus Omnitrophota bacterium]